MGALSSWAMLALTHHFLVQFCAWNAGVITTDKKEWFQDYAILGDDIVIANKQVALRYIRVMKVIGVGLGLHKSLISTRGIALEFAKRTFYNGVDVSPISLLELQSAFSAPAAAVELVRKYKIPLAAFLKACGYGYKVLGGLNRHLGKLNAKVRLIVLAINMPVTVEDIKSFFEMGMPKSGVGLLETKEIIDHLCSTELKRMKRSLNEARYQSYSLEKAHLVAKFIATNMHGRQGENPAYGLNYIFPLVKEIKYQTMIHAKGIVLQSLDQISSQLVGVMMSRYDRTPAELLESIIALQKMIANLPINSLNYSRIFDVERRTMSDTAYIRLWKSLSGILQGTKVVAPGTFGIRDDLGLSQKDSRVPHSK